MRAYRDGASWKFRADDIDRLASEGLPEPPPPSDISLVDRDELVEASPLETLPELDEEFRLADLDDTVTAGGSDAQLALTPDEPSDPSDSILLSDETLGESAAAPPSTIIGKGELESADADLELVMDDEEGSDVRLSGGGASDVLSAGVMGSGVLDDNEKEASHASAFEKLEELELDLAAESSRVLTPDEAKRVEGTIAGAGGKASSKKEGDSDLTLKDGGTGRRGRRHRPGARRSARGDSRRKPKKDTGPTSDLELATDGDDDFVLAEAGGSDITLDSGDSGINLIDPSDSGLALDDIPLEMGGSAILESLALGEPSDAEISLIGSDVAEKPAKGKTKQPAALQTDDDFRLTPLGESEDDGDSSSQVIALDADIAELGAGEAGILGDDAFAEISAEDAGLTEDYGATDDAGLEMAGYVPVAGARCGVLRSCDHRHDVLLRAAAVWRDGDDGYGPQHLELGRESGAQ